MRASYSLAFCARRSDTRPRSAPLFKRPRIRPDGIKNQVKMRGKNSRRKGRKKEMNKKLNKKPLQKEIPIKRICLLFWTLPMRRRVRNQIVLAPLKLWRMPDWRNGRKKWQGRKRIFRERDG
jgi:hypothetical protein